MFTDLLSIHWYTYFIVRFFYLWNTSLLLSLLTPNAIIVPHWIIRSWYTGRWWVGCYIWYSQEGPGRAAASPSPLLAVPNVAAHPSTASVPTTVLLCNGLLLCGFNVTIEGLSFFGFGKSAKWAIVWVNVKWQTIARPLKLFVILFSLSLFQTFIKLLL